MADRIGTGTRNPPIHAEVLAAAQLLCGTADWTFRLVDVVRALSHLNERSVRTHVASRCCENAPENHAHRWPYFRRVRRGVYEILPAYRGSAPGGPVTYDRSATGDRTGDPLTARDSAQSEGMSAIHAVVAESEGWFVVECLEVAVVTQGRSLDETLANLRSALALHLDEEELARTGLSPAPRLVVSYETSAFAPEWRA
ncbi:MAG: type II toxin-antitoxin system HicB family antitoxin [Rhodospirillaceae bacterium]|nr:type II toxin-antitoxin system HicB family antitoxin [Rhodospirillaceae bacterium]MDE0619403.1 type II toxin-antitoxin system HicB family antitoxin [Rhodospirillaceae bacterium]